MAYNLDYSTTFNGLSGMLDKTRRKADARSAQNTRGINDYRILTHRSMHRLTLSPAKITVMLLLPMAFNAATWWLRKIIGAGWATIFEFWITKLGMTGVVTLKAIGPAWLDLALPYMELPSSAPTAATWWITLIITITALLLARFTPDKLLPLRYFVYIVAFIQFTALIFFATIPNAFPYTVSGHIENSLITGTGLIFIIPWVHALIYYIFDFSLLQRFLLTLLTLAFIIIALPFQFMVHTYLLIKFSLLFLPLLHFIFGILLLILACIALYGWAMSWKHN